MSATTMVNENNLQPFDYEPQPYVIVVRDQDPGGVFARILRNIERYPLALKIATLALSIILAITMHFLAADALSGDHAFKVAINLIAPAFPIWGLYEITSFEAECRYQLSRGTLLGGR